MRDWDGKTLMKAVELHGLSRYDIEVIFGLSDRQYRNLLNGVTRISKIHSMAFSYYFGKLRPIKIKIPDLKMSGILCDFCSGFVVPKVRVNNLNRCASCMVLFTNVLAQQRQLALHRTREIVKDIILAGKKEKGK